MLRAALIDLILEQGFDGITVQDITERARLARATFYLHYRDKEDLLASTLEHVFDDLVRRTGRLNQRGMLSDGGSPGLIAFQHAAEHADLYRIILRGQGLGPILPRIREHLAGHLEAQIRPLVSRQRISIPPEVIAHTMTGALLGQLAWWLDHDMPYSPEEMALMFRRMTHPGLIAALGLEAQPTRSPGIQRP